MSGTNQFVLFCTAPPGTANSLSYTDYTALTAILTDGFQTGEASSEQANTVWRQATMGMAVLGQLIALSGQDALDNQDVPGTAAKLLSALADLLPATNSPGDIKASASMTAPSGWNLCDGSSLLRTAYPALFAAIGVAFGSADANHFSLPDLRGMHIRGFDDGRGIDDPSRAFGAYQADQMPSHVHSVNLQPLNSADAGGAGKVATGNNVAEGVIPPFNTSSTGSGTETRVKTLALNYYIFLG